MDNRVRVPPAESAAFTAVAQGARIMGHMFRAWRGPAAGSNLAQVDDLYPFEKVSDRARHYVSAALEHLTLWADYAALLKFHPDAVTVFTMRPTYALARAALESAAQAVWLMDTTDPVECVKRHLRLIRWDLEEHRKSKADDAGKQWVRDRDAQLLERVKNVFAESEIRPPQGYLWVIQHACRPDDLRLDKGEAERLWRAASGAAHGMYWTNLELTQVEPSEEYVPGHVRTVTLPDAHAMLQALRAAELMTQYAALKYLDYAGADIPALMEPARRWLAENITLRPGADEETRKRLIEDPPEAPENSGDQTPT